MQINYFGLNLQNMVQWIKATIATIASFLIIYYWGKFSGFTSFSFAYILHFVLMPWYVYLDPLYHWKYSSTYFHSKNFEKKGSVYEYLGVNIYRKLLVWIGWEKISRKDIRIKNKRSAIEFAEHKSRSSEAGHMIIFLIVIIITTVVADSLEEALWLNVLNLLINVYPIFVQRYNRPRYQRLLKKMD